MKVGIYVGSFNPVHLFHMEIVNYLVDNNIVDKVLVIPTLGYWDKQNLASLKDRINMLKLCETENIKIDTLHNNLEYTYQILDALKEETLDEYYLIIGADNLVNFHLWKNIDKILENKIIVINRNNIDVNKYINGRDNFIVINDLHISNISSTSIREFISSSSYDKLNNVIDEKVLDYIINNNLYRSDNMEELMTIVVRKLDELKKTIATMESCTGGRVAAEITNISGASDVLKFSAVTYSSEYKIKMGVNASTIEKYTVYSPNVAREMSKSIALFANSNYGVGITGKMDVIEDEQKRKENNIIYISIYDKDNDTYYEEKIIGDHLNRVDNKIKVVKEIANKLKEII